MNRVGEINENPFENQIQDIPMNALCNTIERDLKEMLGEKFHMDEGFLKKLNPTATTRLLRGL